MAEVLGLPASPRRDHTSTACSGIYGSDGGMVEPIRLAVETLSFPRRIVVGTDGSRESAAAYAVAQRLAERFGSEVWPVVARGGKQVDKQRVAAIVGDHWENLPDKPVPALVVASTEADLVIVGSRGLHGLKALGSVSERVARQAHCSTLVVRVS